MDVKLGKLAAAVALSVKDRDLGAPPARPVDGDRYIIPGSPMARDGMPADSCRDSHWETRFGLIDSHPS
jgi:hypothetical protein